MKRSNDRILTTHVGSLPRPPELLELAGYAKGPPQDPAEYERRMGHAVLDVVKKQVGVGLDIINDVRDLTRSTATAEPPRGLATVLMPI